MSQKSHGREGQKMSLHGDKFRILELPSPNWTLIEFQRVTEFTDASMPPNNAGMSTHRLSPYKAYYLY